jgi:hypothetical protein
MLVKILIKYIKYELSRKLKAIRSNKGHAVSKCKVTVMQNKNTLIKCICAKFIDSRFAVKTILINFIFVDDSAMTTVLAP